MDDSFRMEVVERMNELLRYLPTFLLRKVPVVLKNLEHVSLSKLSDHAELMLRLEGVEQKNDILVIQLFQNFNFLSEIDQLPLCLPSC